MPSAFAKRDESSARSIIVGAPDASFARNVTRNQKYHAATFLPQVIVEQFKTFSNLYFLLVALSQLIPALKVPQPRSRTGFTLLIPALRSGFCSLTWHRSSSCSPSPSPKKGTTIGSASCAMLQVKCCGFRVLFAGC